MTRLLITCQPTDLVSVGAVSGHSAMQHAQGTGFECDASARGGACPIECAQRHLLGAAGALEALALLVSMQQSSVPPTINVVNPDPNLPEELNVVFDRACSKEIKYALSNTFGFGGHNASVLLKKFE